MLKPKKWSQKLKTCHQFTLFKEIKSVKVKKICKVTNQLARKLVEIETLLVKRAESYF